MYMVIIIKFELEGNQTKNLTWKIQETNVPNEMNLEEYRESFTQLWIVVTRKKSPK